MKINSFPKMRLSCKDWKFERGEKTGHSDIARGILLFQCYEENKPGFEIYLKIRPQKPANFEFKPYNIFRTILVSIGKCN